MMPYTAMSGVAEWEQKVLAIVREIERLMDSTQGPLRIWMHNQMEALLIAAEPGSVIPGGQMTREEMLMYSALFQATLAFRQTPKIAYYDAQGEPVILTPEAMTGYRRMGDIIPLSLSASGLSAVMPPEGAPE